MTLLQPNTGINIACVLVQAGRAALSIHSLLRQVKRSASMSPCRHLRGWSSLCDHRRCAGLATSTGAYLLGVMPPELLAVLGLDLPLMRRDPHYFLPTTQEGKYLLFGSDQEATRSQFLSKFSSQDWSAYQALQVCNWMARLMTCVPDAVQC